MRKKDILKIIKNDFEENTPNVVNKINIDDIEIKPVVNNNKESKFNPFKIIKLSLSLGILVIAIIGIYALINKTQENPNHKVSVTAKDQIVAAYAVTGVNVINNNNNNLLTLSNNINISDLDYVKEFQKYFYLVEDYFKMNTETITITYNENDDYKYQMDVIIENVFGQKDEYILYYNEKREFEDDEEEKKMTGILIHENITYNFRSEEELEEDESEIKVIIYKDNYNNRIEIEKEIENDEYQYEYIIYNNNNEVLEIELEVEDDEMTLEIKSKDNDYEYIISKLSNNKFKIVYDEEEVFYLNIDIENKKYDYSYTEQKLSSNI